MRESGTLEVTADYVVLAIPFAVLRGIDYSRAGFDALKHEAIQDLGRAQNSKTQLQLQRRLWNGRGAWPGLGNGSSYSDKAFATASDPLALVDANAALRRGELVFPGLRAAWNGRATQSIPHKAAEFEASYAYFRVGQYLAFAGYEAVDQGGVSLCGEHTSTDFQGFMEGGASEGGAVPGAGGAGFSAGKLAAGGVCATASQLVNITATNAQARPNTLSIRPR